MPSLPQDDPGDLSLWEAEAPRRTMQREDVVVWEAVWPQTVVQSTLLSTALPLRYVNMDKRLKSFEILLMQVDEIELLVPCKNFCNWQYF